MSAMAWTAQQALKASRWRRKGGVPVIDTRQLVDLIRRRGPLCIDEIKDQLGLTRWYAEQVVERAAQIGVVSGGR